MTVKVTIEMYHLRKIYHLKIKEMLRATKIDVCANLNALLMALVNVLYASNCLHDFMLLVKQLADKTLLVMNIAFLLCLERSRCQSLTSTAGMRFRDITKNFGVLYTGG